jgi:hypothetical protein
MIHEATYIEGDKILANNYHHSHIDDVFRLIHQSNVKKSFMVYLSFLLMHGLSLLYLLNYIDYLGG